MISIQSEDFDLGLEYQKLRLEAGDVGAIAVFSGLVRELYDLSQSDEQQVSSLTLEHYPGMTEKSIAEICEQAKQRWPLLGIRVIHRIGELQPSEQIVLVATASAHRQAAFESAQFIMDFMKSKAPFWKKQRSGESATWIESRDSDIDALHRWEQ